MGQADISDIRSMYMCTSKEMIMCVHTSKVFLGTAD